jgi:glycosyltransferase involved in cell wall biosynthesis
MAATLADRLSTQERSRPPRVSVICSFFNVEDYLAEAIESVLAQDYDDFEFLLVDDGSTDGSTRAAREYAARNPDRISYLEHEAHANRGTCAGRNLGLRHARGEFVALIDGDDVWRPYKLRQQIELLERMPEVDAVFGAANYWASYTGGHDEIIQSGHIQNRPVRPPEALLKVYPLGKGTAPCPDLMIRRAMFDSIGGFEEEFVGSLFLYEDQAFLMKLYLDGTVYFSNRVWLDYRLHDRSCTATGIRERLGWEARRYCLEWFEAYLAGTRYRNSLRIRWALMRALRPYRHPHITKAGRMVKELVRRVLSTSPVKPETPACT